MCPIKSPMGWHLIEYFITSSRLFPLSPSKGGQSTGNQICIQWSTPHLHRCAIKQPLHCIPIQSIGSSISLAEIPIFGTRFCVQFKTPDPVNQFRCTRSLHRATLAASNTSPSKVMSCRVGIVGHADLYQLTGCRRDEKRGGRTLLTVNVRASRSQL
jgi:hypothetical protein